MINFPSVSSKVVMLQSSNTSDNTGAIIGGVVVIVLIIALTIVVITKIIATIMLKSHKVEVTLKQKRQALTPQYSHNIMWSGFLSFTQGL